MILREYNEPILISESKADSRSLIMPHQQEAVNAMTAYFGPELDVQDRNGLVVMPTGSGKTYTAVNWLLTEGITNGYRIVWLVHRQELVEQTYQEFRKQAPILRGTSVSKLKILPISGEHLKMVNACKADIYVCSIASVSNKYGYRFIERMVGAAGKKKLIVVVDEAHHAVAGGYQKVLRRMTALNPNRILLGLTATPTRMQESEQKKLQKMFNIDSNISRCIGNKGFVYEVTLKQLLMSGFLAQPHYIPVNTEIIGEIEYNCTPEDEAFFMQYGELTEKLKANIAKSSVRNKIILDQYLNNASAYGKTIIFVLNQDHAKTLFDDFTAAGVSCDYVVSDKPGSQETIRAFKENKFKVLINVQILTEGSDIPDVQTIFLTRQTNSDSLLMQMIGRGLRGEKAGGTKTANIVAFNDVWTRFATFMDPSKLDIFDQEDEPELETDETQEKIEIAPDDAMLAFLEKLRSGEELPIDGNTIKEKNTGEISSHELYLKLYRIMKASLVSSSGTPEYPIGWYSVVDGDGNDISLLVFESQLKAFRNIEDNIDFIYGKLSVEELLDLYFAGVENKPKDEEIQYLLDYIDDVESMPPYFTFEQRSALDPCVIAAKVNELYEKDSDKEEWLKGLFESAPILQQIYKVFYAFKKTIFDAMKSEVESEIVTEENLYEQYEIVENYFNLPDLLKEVLSMYPLLRTDGLIKISWTDNVVWRYFALCESYETGKYYQLYVNKVLSSPKIDREIIKYLLFHELLHQNGYWVHDDEFRKREWQYPNSAELDGKLDNLWVEYEMEGAYKDAVYDEKHLMKQSDPNVDKQEKPEELTFNPNAKGVTKGTKYCMNCGNKLPDSAHFCNKCGSNVDY